MTLSCNRCGKRLSRKSARFMADATLCSACLFPPLKQGLASVGRNAKRQDPEEGLGPKDEHAVGDSRDAQTSKDSTS